MVGGMNIFLEIALSNWELQFTLNPGEYRVYTDLS